MTGLEHAILGLRQAIDSPRRHHVWRWLVRHRPIAYSAQNQTPAAMTRADMDRVTAAFVDSARRAERDNRRSMVALRFDHLDADLSSRQHNPESVVPSSLLRQAVHSPLRVSTGAQ